MRKLGVVAIVVLGFLSLMQGIGRLASVGGALFSIRLHQTAFLISAALYFGAVAASLLLGLALIVYRDRIAARLFGDDDSAVAIARVDLLRVGIVVVGLELVVTSVPSMVMVVYSAYFQRAMIGIGLVGGSMPGLLSARLGMPLVRFVLGLFVLWIARWLAGRFAGVPVAGEPLRAASPEACPACGAGFDPADYREGVERRCSACHALLDGRSGD